jgi:hypothetical protein
MKQNPFFWLAGLSASVGVGLISLLLFSGSWQKPAPPTQPAPAPQSQVPTPTQAANPAETSAPIAETSAPRREDLVPQAGGPAQSVVRVKPDRVLATVNGVAIKLKDLVPLPKERANTEQMLSAERYDFLIARAVQRELTFQAASALGVELSEDQRQRLAEISSRGEARFSGALDTVQQNPENTEFEQRDFAGVALLAVLAERVGVPSPYATSEQVEEYFQQHQSDYTQIPADPSQRPDDAWAAVDAEIRKKLTPALQAEHDKQFNRMITELLNKANIVVTTQQ